MIPSIKKYNLVPTVKESYRPVSNLQYISKLLEKTVFAQLEEHLSTFSLLPNSQSAYRKQHSTETSLLKVSNDILSQLNQGRSTLLVKLDISAAFDTVNHQMLLERYSDYFGLSDTVLDWFHSYVSNRTQSVQVGSELSEYVEINCGFAQGSTLGGPKYNMFTSPLHELIELHDISHEGYADDSNLYVSFDLKNNVETTDAVLQMENCLSDVTRWMLENRLKLNTTKTEAVLFHPPRTAISPDREIVINMEGHRIDIQQDIESLGVFLDKKMSMKKQVGLTTSKAFYHLRRISQVRKLLNRSITETLVNTLVTSRLDYCNSLLCSLPNSTMKKMQSVQNAAAKLILLKPKRDRVTPLLRELHWLPIKYRFQFKILVITWKIVNGSSPANISGLISEYKQSRSLRSNTENFLVRPGIPRNLLGHRAFSNLSPFLWNGIPSVVRKAESIAEFKSKLKRHFFIEHFGS